MSRLRRAAFLLCAAAAFAVGCDRDAEPPSRPSAPGSGPASIPADAAHAAGRPRDCKVAHIFVALCDNRHQGIAPVPAALGNGQDPAGNLYWGARYGLKTFFQQSGQWDPLLSVGRPGRQGVLERAVFRGRGAHGDLYVVADAYDGSRMETTLSDFLRAAAGRDPQTLRVPAANLADLQAGGFADLVCFVGHNGLMDLTLRELPRHGDGPGPQGAVVLACKSEAYFTEPLRRAGCPPVVTTRGLMAPEAYTLEAILQSWANGDAPAATRRQAAAAYAKYQRCGVSAARRLFGAAP